MMQTTNIRAFLICLALIYFLTSTQTSGKNPNDTVSAARPLRFVGEVKEVTTPVTVTDRHGNPVDGLDAQQFRLTDNGSEQKIHVDLSLQPISMVIAVQANAGVESILPAVRRIPDLLNQLVLGENGTAAVLAFDHRIELKQPFTTDFDRIDTAVRTIHAGSSASRLTDAVGEAVRLLANEPETNRRIILLISETRDLGSEGRKSDVLLSAEINNVQVYAVDMSRFVEAISGKSRKAPRPDPLPPTQRQGRMPAFVPATPTSVEATFGQNGQRAEFVPLFKEVLRDVHDVFVDNPVELMTKGTGGKEYGFMGQRGLEEALGEIGRELHSQYMVTYTPNNPNEAGFHEIAVSVTGFPHAKVRTRPGYWVAAKYQ